ncbi:MAG: tRNA 5-methoxyuridine(34)/uridine 5-oxyacetic acid(34) synthase CmoB [Candidatus Marinamargulisbacteria bacterium]
MTVLTRPIDMETFFFDACDAALRLLPNDERVNKVQLKTYLADRWQTYQNPNTHRFFEAVQQLPVGGGTLVPNLNGPVTVEFPNTQQLQGALKGLVPWRKGPFLIGDTLVNAEWQSNLKWDRFKSAYSMLKDARVLDIGCGNAYTMLKMLDHNPRMVMGVDPSDLAFTQFLAIQRLIQHDAVGFLPIGWGDLTPIQGLFDVVLCMGVFYHHRSPVDLLKTVRQVARPGVSLWLDTIIIPGDDDVMLFPKDRYAKMRNVYFIPTLPALKNTLMRAGFKHIDVLDVSVTTPNEQRVTDWTFNQSLGDFLDPNDATKTIEGYPAPQRVALVARLQ